MQQNHINSIFKMTQDCILIINAGSSSVKFAAFASSCQNSSIQKLNHGHIEFRIGGERVCAALVLRGTKKILSSHDNDINIISSWLENSNLRVVAIGHRVVHGGNICTELTKLNKQTIEQIASLQNLAPLHQHHALHYINAMQQFDVPQFAYFDTAFHSTVSLLARRFAIPNRFFNDGVRRYGFHGIAYESVLQQLGDKVSRKILAAHLGNGCSMCAIIDGQSVDTTMSFTPLDGLIMGTRCGAIDPGVILHLQQNYQMTAEDIADLLYKNSGLKGISELSNDMRLLEEQMSTNPKAQLAVEMFCYSAIKQMSSLIGIMGGIDMLVFSGGIGENSSYIRYKIAEGLNWLGCTIDNGSNQANNQIISAKSSKVQVMVAKIDEEMMIASKIIEQ